MLVQEESLPKANIYSSKVLFEQVDIRNKKRMAQMLKRKTALSTKNKLLEPNNKDSPSKTTVNSPKKNENDNELIFVKVIRDKENNTNNIINSNPINNQIILDIRIDSELENKDKEDIDKENKDKEKEIVSPNNFNNKIKLDNSSAVSNIVNENNNYYNNSSTNNSNNNSTLFKDSQEKEINISNLDNDSIDDIIINKEDEDNAKINTTNIFDYDKDDKDDKEDKDDKDDKDDFNLINKDENKLKEENEFALKYLSSSSDSFVPLDNHLVARAKAQGGDMTDSYLQALFPLLSLDNNKLLKNKNYEVTDTIKEEKEIDTPLRKKDNNSKNSKDIIDDINDLNNESNDSIDINLNISGINSNNDCSFIKSLKKSSNKKKIISNYQIYNKNNKCKMKNNNISIKEIKHKGDLSFKTNNKIIKKNNTISNIAQNKSNILKKKCLNYSSSLSNINNTNNNFNKYGNKKNNQYIFNSSFSTNLYKKTKTEINLNKNNNKTINLKKSFNNLHNNKNENELNDSLISNYIQNFNKPKNLKNNKINNHYIKNINNYQKYKNNHINKNNLAENNSNKFNAGKTNINKRNYLINDKYLTYYNSIDITKRNKILTSKNIAKKFLDYNSSKINKRKNNISISINNNKDIFQKSKNINSNITKIKTRINHRQTSSLLYTSKNYAKNNSIQITNSMSKYNILKSSSKQNINNTKINSFINQDCKLKRSKTQKKLSKLNKSNNDIKYLNSTFELHHNSKNVEVKKRLPNFYKKIDYSYVKPKVETGLSEEMLKKLLNNNKKMTKKQTNKKINTEKKQSLIKRCKLTMNKTIDNFKEMVSGIKKKLFKGENKEKKNVNDEIKTDYIYSCRNSKIISKNKK